MPTGADPIAAELQSAYGTQDIYGMHWLQDVDNKYGYGNTPGGGCELGPNTGKPSYINSYQRGPQEGVFETIPQPTCDNFVYGGPNGYLDLFIKDSSYAKQWKYTDAPDADARAIQAAYWADTWAKAQGQGAAVAATVAKAGKMGDYLRYSFFDKYFKQIGNCTSPTACPAVTSGRGAEHYLLSWYYAWGGSSATSGGWAWRIGDSAAHQGYQNPMAAYALVNDAAMKPLSTTGVSDWTTSLSRQLEFYQWLQSADGAIAGGATNSWDGAYATPPTGDSTFYGMFYDPAPVFHDPNSNQWFGFQAWSLERVAEYYYTSGDARAKTVLDKWVSWALSQTTINANGTYQFPSTLTWTGQPDTWNPTTPGANASLHVTVVDYTNDVGWPPRTRRSSRTTRPSPGTPRPRPRPRRSSTTCGTTARTRWAFRSRRPARTTTGSPSPTRPASTWTACTCRPAGAARCRTATRSHPERPSCRSGPGTPATRSGRRCRPT